MIKQIHQKTHDITAKGIKKITSMAKSVARKDEKKITLSDILNLYPKGKIFLNNSNGEPIYNFNMDNPNVLFQNLDKEVEKIEVAMFPDDKTNQGAFVFAIKLK